MIAKLLRKRLGQRLRRFGRNTFIATLTPASNRCIVCRLYFVERSRCAFGFYFAVLIGMYLRAVRLCWADVGTRNKVIYKMEANGTQKYYSAFEIDLNTTK